MEVHFYHAVAFIVTEDCKPLRPRVIARKDSATGNTPTLHMIFRLVTCQDRCLHNIDEHRGQGHNLIVIVPFDTVPICAEILPE